MSAWENADTPYSGWEIKPLTNGDFEVQYLVSKPKNYRPTLSDMMGCETEKGAHGITLIPEGWREAIKRTHNTLFATKMWYQGDRWMHIQVHSDKPLYPAYLYIEPDPNYFVGGGVTLPPLPDFMSLPTDTPITTILNKREETYGDFPTLAGTVQAMEKVMRNNPGWDRLPAYVKEALRMILHKVVRIVNGGKYEYKDSWDDISGYAQLASTAAKAK
jgi:hypothetical protein